MSCLKGLSSLYVLEYPFLMDTETPKDLSLLFCSSTNASTEEGLSLYLPLKKSVSTGSLFRGLIFNTNL